MTRKIGLVNWAYLFCFRKGAEIPYVTAKYGRTSGPTCVNAYEYDCSWKDAVASATQVN